MDELDLNLHNRYYESETSQQSTNAISLDILDIDSKIRTFFSNEKNNICDIENNIIYLSNIAKVGNLRSKMIHDINCDIKNLKKRLDDITKYSFYDIYSCSIIKLYIKSITTPMENYVLNKELETIRLQYIYLLHFFGFMSFVGDDKLLDRRRQKNDIYCDLCNQSQFIKNDDVYICKQCCKEITNVFKSSSSDHKFVIQTKYIYDRKMHFKDCINQYQGKQNTYIDPKIYTALQEQLINHRIISKNETDLSNVSRSHILYFLKELGFTKHYEDVILIHHVLTGIQPDNIESLESKLLRDFDLLIEQYDVLFKDIDRKNFINTQYVLFQLLRKYNYPCNKSDFNILKTSDKKTCHDEICKTLFNVLGWRYTFT